MQKSRIDFGIGQLHSWNPLVGCKHGCLYCWARRMNDRFKWIPDWREIKYYPERLIEPFRLKKPSKIFVCSMSDLFGDWVDFFFIEHVLHAAQENPQHEFYFLTKNPIYMAEFVFPDNCRCGITVELEEKYYKRMKYLRETRARHKFLSIEPLLGPMNIDLTCESNLDFIIVGADTSKKNPILPKHEWIEGLQHPNIFWKKSMASLRGETIGISISGGLNDNW